MPDQSEEDKEARFKEYCDYLIPILTEIADGSDASVDLSGLADIKKVESKFVDESEKVVVLKEHVEEPQASDHEEDEKPEEE